MKNPELDLNIDGEDFQEVFKMSDEWAHTMAHGIGNIVKKFTPKNGFSTKDIALTVHEELDYPTILILASKFLEQEVHDKWEQRARKERIQEMREEMTSRLGVEAMEKLESAVKVMADTIDRVKKSEEN